MRVILYLRVSTDDQSHGMQLDALKAFCSHEDWEIVETVTETGSGAKNDRPKRAEIITRAARRNRSFDAVAVWKLDRWGRSSGDLILGLEALTANGVGFYSITERFDLTTPAGRALAGMLAVFAQFERDMIKERVNAGITRYREKYQKWGRPATARQVSGYVRDLREKGIAVPEIAKRAGISRASVWRILKEGKKNE